MERKLFVGNLSYSTTSEELRSVFSEIGEVEEAIVMTDRMTGRSRGFGFVTMKTEEGAASAIESLHGKMVGGREITVNEARPREERPMGGAPRGGSRW